MEHIALTVQVPDEYHGQRIDAVLAQLIPDYSRSQICNWIKKEEVLVNNKACKPKDKAQAGDVIEISVHFSAMDIESASIQPENIPLNIVYEDQELMVIDKPAGLVVHPGAGNPKHTLVNALVHHDPDLVQLPRAGIIHRLDKETTGLLIIAKTLTAHTALIRQMQAREIQRNYITLVQGTIIAGATINTGFGRHPRNRLKMAVVREGRQAITHYRVNKRYTDFTLLNVRLMTGRTHQIRVHLQHIHHPVVGDPLYAGRMKFPPNASESLLQLIHNFKRQALHAASLQFIHPKSAKELTFTAPLPDDFQELLNALDAHYENQTS